MGIYQLVMRQTTTAQGDFDRTSEGLANQLRQLDAQVEETKTAFGEGFLGALKEGNTTLNDTRNAVSLLDDSLEGLGRGLGLSVNSINRLIPSLERVQEGTEEYAEANIVAKLSQEALARQTDILLEGSLFPFTLWLRTTTNLFNRFNDDLQRALRGIDELTDDYFDLYKPGGSGSSASEAVARLTKETDNWSASMAYANYNMTEAVLEARKWGQQNKKLEDDLQSSGGGARQTAKEFVKLKQVFKDIAEEGTFAVIGIKNVSGKVGEAVNEAVQAQLDTTSTLINEQIEVIKRGEQAIADLSQGIVNTVLGNLGFVTQDAEGNALTAEEIVKLFIGDTANQKKAVEAIAQQIGTELPPALLNQVLALPSDTAIALADYLGKNPEMLTKLTDNYDELATYTETALGIPMGKAFAMIGDDSAIAMIESARKQIKEEANAFKRFVKRNLDTEVTVNVRYNYINPPGQTTVGSTSAVRSIQSYERMNGRSWRS